MAAAGAAATRCLSFVELRRGFVPCLASFATFASLGYLPVAGRFI
jgi:hypothetical protein